MHSERSIESATPGVPSLHTPDFTSTSAVEPALAKPAAAAREVISPAAGSADDVSHADVLGGVPTSLDKHAAEPAASAEVERRERGEVD